MQQTRFSFLITPLILLIELVLLFGVLFHFIDLQYNEKGVDYPLRIYIKAHYKAYIILSAFWYFIGSSLKVYSQSRGMTLAFYLERTFYQLLLFSILLFAVSGLKSDDLLNVQNSLRFLASFTISIYFFRVALFFFIKWYRKSGFNNRNILFVDQNSNTENFVTLFKKRKDLGYRINGIINGKDLNGMNIKNFNLQDFALVLEKFHIDTIFLSLEGELPMQSVGDIKLLASKKKIKLNFIPSATMLGYNDLSMNYIYTYPILQEVKNPLDHFFNRFMKRMLDIFLSVLALSFLSVTIFPIISLLIYIDSGLPIFFKQKRKGINEKVFDCYKFRTMKVNEFSDQKVTTKGDKRITKIGQFLRSTSLDELPQLFNVVKGDMSLVGPRPHMIQQDQNYDNIIKYYSLRNHVKPGITGLAQVNGFRGEINTEEDMRNRVRTDIFYIRNWTFSLDLIIMIKTVYNMIMGDENAI